MVRFEKDRFVVEVENHFPASAWLSTVTDIVHAISAVDKERVSNEYDFIYGLCDLLEAMLPDEKTAALMNSGGKQQR